jgi:hypothetical protein
LFPVKAVDTTARKAIKYEFGYAKKLSMQLSEKLLNMSPVKTVITAAGIAITHQFGYARKSCQKLSSL